MSQQTDLQAPPSVIQRLYFLGRLRMMPKMAFVYAVFSVAIGALFLAIATIITYPILTASFFAGMVSAAIARRAIKRFAATASDHSFRDMFCNAH